MKKPGGNTTACIRTDNTVLHHITESDDSMLEKRGLLDALVFSYRVMPCPWVFSLALTDAIAKADMLFLIGCNCEKSVRAEGIIWPESFGNNRELFNPPHFDRAQHRVELNHGIGIAGIRIELCAHATDDLQLVGDFFRGHAHAVQAFLEETRMTLLIGLVRTHKLFEFHIFDTLGKHVKNTVLVALFGGDGKAVNMAATGRRRSEA